MINDLSINGLESQLRGETLEMMWTGLKLQIGFSTNELTEINRLTAIIRNSTMEHVVFVNHFLESNRTDNFVINLLFDIRCLVNHSR